MVRPVPITITTGSASKDYDGKPLENSEAHLTGTMAYDERAIVTATGTITDAGSTVNGYRIVWENALASNYDITEDL